MSWKRGLFAVALAWFSMVSFAEPLTSLSPQKYRDFLVNPWDPGKPSLIALKDPRCPYCIKALEKRERLDNYNVFLFWAPILGPNSVNQVDRFFHCNTPVEAEVLDAVIARKYPLCAGSHDDDLQALNDQVIAAFNPNSVPQYWYGGQRVALSQLNLALPKYQRLQLLAQTSPLKIQWERYSPHSISQPVSEAVKIGVVLPHNKALPEEARELMLREDNINWYVFDNKSTTSLKDAEFRLLTDLHDVETTTIIVGGKILTASELSLIHI